jgi:FAD/FMN-containing dehydrogenase
MIRAILGKTGAAVPVELEKEEWCVYSSCEGNEAVVLRVSRDLEKTAHEAGALRSRILEPAEDEALGGMLREAFEWLRWGSPANVICRLAMPEVTQSTVEELCQLAESVSLRAALLVRAAAVVYFVAFAESEDDWAMVALTRIATAVNSLARTKMGSATLLHAPVAIKKSVAVMRSRGVDSVLQQRVKQAFDPSGVFAPGRVVGGI